MRKTLIWVFLLAVAWLNAQFGNLPVIEVQEMGGLNYGDEYIGYPSAPLDLHIANSGGANLEIYQIAVGLDDFIIQYSAFPVSIAPGASITVPVVFQPGHAGVISDSLYIINNDPQCKEYPVHVQGRGVVVPLSEVNNVQINVAGEDVVINWDPVTTNILGGAANPDRYVVYFSQYPSGPTFWPLAVVTSQSFVHQRAAVYAPSRFYLVKAIRL
ncbi:MAG: hypothetical protein KBB33_03445 [Candidatus Cloacimonetes bacterium]|jgi:hypothetical protein|nr:hypothetical protein [Candidatus Cloacimonadota bacterium]HOA28448.1 hypothetical protein [Candidatus Cloacimonadota bacterium]HOH59371.1 hypothetical protein [Candidatus Cloacimonadota bacterium]HPI25751.1 hypothetical protein [Candidatus Cloacimonadota bacterium]